MPFYKGETARVITPKPFSFDITGYTITTYVRKPDATIVTKSGSIVDATTGQHSWTTASTDINAKGAYWSHSKAVSGSTVRYNEPEVFYVEDVLT